LVAGEINLKDKYKNQQFINAKACPKSDYDPEIVAEIDGKKVELWRDGGISGGNPKKEYYDQSGKRYEIKHTKKGDKIVRVSYLRALHLLQSLVAIVAIMVGIYVVFWIIQQFL
jgi:hypothetical protein